MKAAKRHRPVPVEEYLEAEERATIKHEYVDGFVYAMSGARNVHNRIATNVLVALGVRLRGGPCQTFNSDTKVRISRAGVVRFYYPDAQVTCRPNPDDDVFQDHPIAIFEVLSNRTRRTDEGEKREAYLSLPSVAVYALVEQASPTVVALRRAGDGFTREVHEGPGATLPLPELSIELPLAEVYDGVVFKPRRPVQRLR